MKRNDREARAVRAYFDGVTMTEEYKQKLLSLKAELPAAEPAEPETERETHLISAKKRSPFAAAAAVAAVLAAVLALTLAIAAAAVLLPRRGTSTGNEGGSFAGSRPGIDSPEDLWTATSPSAESVNNAPTDPTDPAEQTEPVNPTDPDDPTEQILPPVPQPGDRQGMIGYYLAVLNAEDAEYNGEQPYDVAFEIGMGEDGAEYFTVFREAQKSMVMCFSQDNGLLQTMRIMEEDAKLLEQAGEITGSDWTGLRQTSQALAERLAAPISAGQLRLVNEERRYCYSRDDHQNRHVFAIEYQWVEYSGDVPTGTIINIYLLKDGSASYVNIIRGTVWERYDPADLIGEEAAQEAALQALQQRPPKKDFHVEQMTCALEVIGDNIYYRVIFAESTDPLALNYHVFVDPFTGEASRSWDY